MPNNYQNIPQELKIIPAWCCWRYEDIGAKKPTKVPHSLKGGLANVNDPKTWCDFATAIAATDYDGIGFILSDNDHFTFLDLDDTLGDQVALNRQIEIYREFDSYSEISPSGKGLHIIVRGIVPAGRRRSFIEIYSSQRYATFTGNVYPINQPKPIRECQDKLMRLWEQMGSGPATYIYQGEQDEKYTDEQIITQASNAVNGDKFRQLWTGKWAEIYQSQSEADFAIINIIAFYTQNRNQIGRLFRASSLGKRNKANRQDYLNWMINKSFDRMLPPIDFDGFKNQLELKVAEQQLKVAEQQFSLKLIEGKKQTIVDEPTLPGITPVAQLVEPTAHNGLVAGSNPAGSTVAIPPGLLGELAQFIYLAAPRPVPEIALAGAIGLMAGIVGRAYNISGTGLNQYILLLAKTGRGKEGIASGIDKLMNAVRLTVPTSSRFRGPGIINSGQALTKHISNTSNCFVSVLGEFGMTIDRISTPYANSADKMLYQMLLDLYNKSGHGQTLQPSIYAKREDNTAIVESPAITILGESNPKIFYDILNEGMIAAGLLPRFLIVEYNGDRVPTNEGHENVQPVFGLIDRFASLIANVEGILNGRKVINISYEEKAFAMLRDFDKYADWKINSARDDVIEELWNRAHMKALRLSGLIAVGVNMINPLIEVAHAEWALKLVQTDIRALSSKFETGEIGTNSLEIKQLNETIRMIKEFIIKDWDHVKKYVDNLQKMHIAKVIPYAFLNKRLANNAAFKNDKIGATGSMKRAIQILIDRDDIREVSKQQVTEKFNTAQRCFIISNVKILD